MWCPKKPGPAHIFLPKHYPKEFIMNQRFWTEQYLVQAFLAFNKSFQIIWAYGIMEIEHAGELASCLPLGIGHGGSLWLKRIE
jgi:hypothetical protein